MKEWLVDNRGVTAEEARLFAHISGGAPGRAVRFQQEPALLKKRNAIISELYKILDADRVYRFKYISRFDYPFDLPRTRWELTEILNIWFSFWRDVLLCASGASLPFSNIDHIDNINKLAKNVGLVSSRQLVSETQRAKNLIEKNVNPRLVVEEMILKFPFEN